MVYIIVGIFILFDFATGLLNAIYQGNVDSTILRKGLFHKLSELLAVAGSGLFEYCAEYINLGFEIPVLEAVAGYICLMEFISVCENLSKMNPGLAKLFDPYLAKLNGKEKDDGK